MKAAALTVCTLLLCLLVGEVALRLLDGYSLAHVALVATRPPSSGAATDPAREVTLVQQRHLSHMPLVDGVRPEWFAEDPPPPAGKARPVDPARQQALLDFLARGLLGPQSSYVWNQVAAADNTELDWTAHFGSLPAEIETFTPGNRAPFPRFRFPPSQHLPMGMVTDRHGWRGEEFRYENDPRRVLIAFVGASTTQEDYSFPFSYPERVGFWLNRWAEANAVPLRFDIINAGREGLGSRDIAAIVEEEIQPLQPDFIIYLEGSNQTLAYRSLVQRPPGGSIPPMTPPRPTRLQRAAGFSAMLARVQFGLDEYGHTLREPPKPAYGLYRDTLRLDGVRQGDYRRLPLNLDVICNDLARIARVAKTGHGRLFVSTFTWFNADGIALNAHRHRHIYDDLNARTWPLTNADWHELMTFQNDVLRAFALQRGVGLLEVDSQLPQDPDLFVDPIHVTSAGSRLRGWTVFNLLLPHIRTAWQRGELPSAHPRTDWHYGPITRFRRPTEADAPVAPVNDAPTADDRFHLSRYTALDPTAQITRTGRGVRVRTGNRQWSRAIGFDYLSPRPEALEVEVKLRVWSGSVGVGLLRSNHPDTLGRQIINAADTETTVRLRFTTAESISHLLFENALGEGVSDFEVLGITVR